MILFKLLSNDFMKWRIPEIDTKLPLRFRLFAIILILVWICITIASIIVSKGDLTLVGASIGGSIWVFVVIYLILYFYKQHIETESKSIFKCYLPKERVLS